MNAIDKMEQLNKMIEVSLLLAETNRLMAVCLAEKKRNEFNQKIAEFNASHKKRSLALMAHS